jgi:hypothetical protein
MPGAVLPTLFADHPQDGAGEKKERTLVLARVGHVLGWTGNTIACLFLASL